MLLLEEMAYYISALHTNRKSQNKIIILFFHPLLKIPIKQCSYPILIVFTVRDNLPSLSKH